MRKRYKRQNIINFTKKRIFKFAIILLFVNCSNYIYIQTINDEVKQNYWIAENTTEIINNYLSIFKGIYSKDLMEEINKIKQYFSLKILDKNENSSLNLKIIKKLRKELKKRIHKNVSPLKKIFILSSLNFGNQIMALNNLIYYCEVLGIKKIYLNSSINWYMKNSIKTNKIQISVISQKDINCNSKETYCGKLINFYYPIVIKPKRRAIILKDEIKNNLPKISTDNKDLYIYIRSGDSFQHNGNGYTPAPYCFYQKILSNYKFNDIYLISGDDKSPIIKELLKDYPNIKHKLNSIEIDMATLIYSYNLVNSFSSFSQATIAFNDNLNNLFEYEVYKLESAIVHFHYDIDKLNKTFNIFRMKPSEYYTIKMHDWKNSEEQRKILFSENCKYDFIKTKYKYF